jgi:transcriptional regulator with XRE-family HTH domain
MLVGVNDDEKQLEDSPWPPVDLTLEVGPGMEIDNRQFGELLERIRWKAGLSRADAAAKLGLSSEYLRLIEVGKRTPALGQMQNFLATYGADAAVEQVMPGGERPDLLVLDPLNDEPVIVEFKSRIREARRSAPGGPPKEEDWPKDLDHQMRVQDSLSASRAKELGLVVSLLTRAGDSTLRKIRELLEDEIG